MFENRLVAVLNEKIEPGVALNAVSHMSFGIGAYVGQEQALLSEYRDADDNFHSRLTQMPIIILKANNNKIKKTVKQAQEQEIYFVDFIDTMRLPGGGTYVEQIAATKQKKFDELTYFGVMLFGPAEKISLLTKKFSLWK